MSFCFSFLFLGIKIRLTQRQREPHSSTHSAHDSRQTKCIQGKRERERGRPSLTHSVKTHTLPSCRQLGMTTLSFILTSLISSHTRSERACLSQRLSLSFNLFLSFVPFLFSTHGLKERDCCVDHAALLFQDRTHSILMSLSFKRGIKFRNENRN